MSVPTRPRDTVSPLESPSSRSAARIDEADFSDSAGGASAPPGHLLRLVLENEHMSQAQLATRTGLSTKHINQVIQGLVTLSPEVALVLERALGVASKVWNDLEAKYQDTLARERATEELGQHTGWLRNFPIKELRARGILDARADQAIQVGQLLAFFQVADPRAYAKVWSGPVASGFRRSEAYKVDAYSTAVWLRLGELGASQLDLAPYQQDKFVHLLPGLRELTLWEDSRAALLELQQRCRRVGVAVVFVPGVKGSIACGAARWPRPNNPMIVMSGRGGFADIFWFSFFHEAAHVVLHAKRETYIHVSAHGDDSDGLEAEADRAATRHLIGAKVSGQLRPGLTHGQVRALAEQAGVHEGIIAGQLCHLMNDYVRYSKLRRAVTLPES